MHQNLNRRKGKCRHNNIIGISKERALHVHSIKPMESFLNEQCVNIVERILKDPNHPVTTGLRRNKYNNNIIMPPFNIQMYQNTVLQKSIRIIRNGFVNKYTDPRRIETTTPSYRVSGGTTSKHQNQNSYSKQPNFQHALRFSN